jgi:bacterioferritin-associated ferredoxin/predicted DNA binding CopG/RHH family protein
MDNNPLKQYFRRPSVYLRLPSNGVGYNENIIDLPENGEIPIYPMTAIDEITTRTPDALFNGTAVIELIKSCVPNIKDPWMISNIDMDAILVAIKSASSESGEMNIETSCPKCETDATYGISLAAILGSISSPDYSTELAYGDLYFKLKPISYREINNAAMEQFEFQKLAAQVDNIEDDELRNKTVKEALDKITNITMNLLSHSIEHIKTPTSTVDDRAFILEFLRNCDKKIYTAIRDHSGKLREEAEIKPMPVKCTSCEHEYKQIITLNPTDFFD